MAEPNEKDWRLAKKIRWDYDNVGMRSSTILEQEQTIAKYIAELRAEKEKAVREAIDAIQKINKENFERLVTGFWDRGLIIRDDLEKTLEIVKRLEVNKAIAASERR